MSLNDFAQSGGEAHFEKMLILSWEGNKGSEGEAQGVPANSHAVIWLFSPSAPHMQITE